jgi:hypothetical protein
MNPLRFSTPARIVSWALGWLLAALLASAPALAQSPSHTRMPRMAVLSQIGDSLSVIGERDQTGSRLDQNLKTELPLRDGGMDRNALLMLRTMLRERQPVLPAPLMLYVPGVKLCGDGCMDGDRFVPPPDLAEALSSGRVSHLLLIVPSRSTSGLRFMNTVIGEGRIEGLGFYVDHSTLVRSVQPDGREVSGQGYLGAFAYVRLRLIDVNLRRVIDDRTLHESSTFGAGRSAGGNSPWDALDNTEKIKALDGLLRTGFERVVPEMLKHVKL